MFVGIKGRSWTPTCFLSLGRRHYIAALLASDLFVSIPHQSPPLHFLLPRPQPLLVPPPAMACLTDLVNLNLSDTTEKIIAEYIWYVRQRPPC